MSLCVFPPRRCFFQPQRLLEESRWRWTPKLGRAQVGSHNVKGGNTLVESGLPRVWNWHKLTSSQFRTLIWMGNHHSACVKAPDKGHWSCVPNQMLDLKVRPPKELLSPPNLALRCFCSIPSQFHPCSETETKSWCFLLWIFLETFLTQMIWCTPATAYVDSYTQHTKQKNPNNSKVGNSNNLGLW